MKIYNLIMTLVAILFVPAAGAEAVSITNGDFEAGNTGFGSDYLFAMPNDGGALEYGVASNTTDWNWRFDSFRDHTTGSGLMLIVNGSNFTTDRVWYQQLNVSVGQTYELSLFAASAFPDNPANLLLEVDGVQFANLDLTGFATGNWQEITGQFTAAITGPVTLSLRDTVTASHSGDDFAIDDISITTIPEPATFGLATIGMFVLGCRRRKQV